METKQKYTCVSKAGEFEMVGKSVGAGPLKGTVVIVYRDEAGQLFHRDPTDFAQRMKKTTPEAAAINADLLKAAEGFMLAVAKMYRAEEGWASVQDAMSELVGSEVMLQAAIDKAKGVE